MLFFILYCLKISLMYVNGKECALEGLELVVSNMISKIYYMIDPLQVD